MHQLPCRCKDSWCIHAFPSLMRNPAPTTFAKIDTYNIIFARLTLKLAIATILIVWSCANSCYFLSTESLYGPKSTCLKGSWIVKSIWKYINNSINTSRAFFKLSLDPFLQNQNEFDTLTLWHPIALIGFLSRNRVRREERWRRRCRWCKGWRTCAVAQSSLLLSLLSPPPLLPQ